MPNADGRCDLPRRSNSGIPTSEGSSSSTMFLSKGEMSKVWRSKEQPGPKREPGKLCALRASDPKSPLHLRHAGHGMGCQDGWTSFVELLVTPLPALPPARCHDNHDISFP